MGLCAVRPETLQRSCNAELQCSPAESLSERWGFTGKGESLRRCHPPPWHRHDSISSISSFLTCASLMNCRSSSSTGFFSNRK